MVMATYRHHHLLPLPRPRGGIFRVPNKKRRYKRRGSQSAVMLHKALAVMKTDLFSASASVFDAKPLQEIEAQLVASDQKNQRHGHTV